MCLPCVMQTKAATQGSISLTLHSLTQTTDGKLQTWKWNWWIVLFWLYTVWGWIWGLTEQQRKRMFYSGLDVCQVSGWDGPFIDIYVWARCMSLDITESYSCPTAYRNTTFEYLPFMSRVSPTDLRLDEVRTWECQWFIVKHAENSETQREESKSSVL